MQEVRPYRDSLLNKKKQITQMFDTISGEYDRLNRVISFGLDVRWRKRLVEMSKGYPSQKILDVATGTADLAISLSSITKTNQVVGIDISPEMLAVGREKVTSMGLENQIQLCIGDSESLDFEDQSFDLVTVAFGVRNFENLTTGLLEIYRVLRPGGRLLLLETSVPTHPLYKFLYNIHSRWILPLIGRIFSKDYKAYSYLSESAMAFPHGKAFSDILRKVGFSSATHYPQSFGVACIYVAVR